MSEQLAIKLSSSSFGAESFVQHETQNALDVESLISLKQKIQFLSDETNGSLKKNVYQNYRQFIETSKEISYLESEMYQLSHMLTEQQSVINALVEFSIIGSKAPSAAERQAEKKDDESNKNISTLLEKVEGCASVLDVRGRYLVHCGELMETSSSEPKKIQKIYAVMLNDGLMLASPLSNRRGPVQYKFQDLYELDSLAIVNVPDDHQHKNAFKVLMFPDTRLFLCDTSQAKKEWLEVIDKLKKEKITPTGIRRESFILETKNPFIEDRVSLRSFYDGNVEDYVEAEVPELLLELPEELDVHIAQRDFEGAVELVHKANDPKYTLSKEMRARIDHRIKQLVDVLMNELRVSPDKSLQGGPRAARRAVHLLIRLGKSSQACSLFLKHRSAILRQAMRHQKVEGATTPYVSRLCTVFFNSMIDTGREFTRAFTNSHSCASAFVIWARCELLRFVQIFSRHVFTMQVALSTVAECVSMVRVRCQQLCEIGLDLVFVLDGVVRTDVENMVIESKNKLVEAVKLRAADDKWLPQNLQNKAGISRFLEDMMDIGISGIVSFIYDECYVSLSLNTTTFCKAYMNYCEDLMKLYTPTMQPHIVSSLVEGFQAQMRHIEASLASDKFKTEHKFILNNGKFLLDTILSLAEQNYEKVVGENCSALADLRKSHLELLNSSVVHTPVAPPKASASVTKYSSSAYL